MDAVWAVSCGHRRSPQSSGAASLTCAWERESQHLKHVQARAWLDGGSSIKRPFQRPREPFFEVQTEKEKDRQNLWKEWNGGEPHQSLITPLS